MTGFDDDVGGVDNDVDGNACRSGCCNDFDDGSEDDCGNFGGTFSSAMLTVFFTTDIGSTVANSVKIVSDSLSAK